MFATLTMLGGNISTNWWEAEVGMGVEGEGIGSGREVIRRKGWDMNGSRGVAGEVW